MSYTVNSSFKIFLTEIVNLDPERTEKARASRDWLMSQINLLSQKGIIPPLYNEVSPVFYGSFARRTKLRPLNDIDIMIVFKAQGCTADTVDKIQNHSYSINLYPFSTILPIYSDEGMLNSRKMIEGIKKAVGSIANYKKAELHRNQEALTLQLNSYEWNFDIVPSFYTTTGFYLIPDGKGKWKGTDPRIDHEKTKSANVAKQGMLLPIIRLMKFWKKKYWGDAIASYLFENFIIDWANSVIFLPNSFPRIIESCLEYLSTNIMKDYNDPKSFQGNINELNFNERYNLSLKTSGCLNKVRQAISYEQNNQMESAINKWREIFGNEFPEYGKLYL